MEDKIIKKLMDSVPKTEGTNPIYWNGEFSLTLDASEVHYLLILLDYDRL